MHAMKCCIMAASAAVLLWAGTSAPGADNGPSAGTTLPTIPRGLPPLAIPDDNPMTPEKIELGRMLYFDKRMSKDGTISCATCHDPQLAWTEHEPTSAGIGKQLGGRNSPTVINAAYASRQFWDGRAATLEEQATGPVENPIEMGHSMAAVCQELAKVPDYQRRFKEVFGTEVTKENFAKAVAAFERTVLSGDSPYDQYTAGDKKAMNERQIRGMKLFMESGCSDCHKPPLFSTYDYYNAGVGIDKAKPDLGRKDVTRKAEDSGAVPGAGLARGRAHGSLLPRRQREDSGGIRGVNGGRR